MVSERPPASVGGLSLAALGVPFVPFRAQATFASAGAVGDEALIPAVRNGCRPVSRRDPGCQGQRSLSLTALARALLFFKDVAVGLPAFPSMLPEAVDSRERSVRGPLTGHVTGRVLRGMFERTPSPTCGIAVGGSAYGPALNDVDGCDNRRVTSGVREWRYELRPVADEEICSQPCEPFRGCHPARQLIGRTRSRPDPQPHHPPPLRYLPVSLEAELLE
jgi:hypothetical protein